MSKTAIVTGGSRGIGRATAIELSRMGMNVAVIYCGNQAKAEETVASCKENGVDAIAIKCDVKVKDEVEAAVAKVQETFGSVNVLVNNAGVTKDGLLLRMSEEDFDTVIDTNLKGCFLFSKSCASIMMKQRSGKIINIASIVGLQGNAGQANYAASKAGIIGFTKSLAKELGSRGINVNAVAPGFVETDMTEVLSDKVKEAFLNMVPLKRTAKPEDIANAIGFLASEKADYITGQVLTVDGGMCMYSVKVMMLGLGEKSVPVLTDFMLNRSDEEVTGPYEDMMIMLTHVGIKSPQNEIYQALRAGFRRMKNKVIAVICIGDYGDPRGIALLKGYLDRTTHTIDRETFYEALSAIRRLGGEINDIQDPFHDFTNKVPKKDQEKK